MASASTETPPGGVLSGGLWGLQKRPLPRSQGDSKVSVLGKKLWGNSRTHSGLSRPALGMAWILSYRTRLWEPSTTQLMCSQSWGPRIEALTPPRLFFLVCRLPFSSSSFSLTSSSSFSFFYPTTPSNSTPPPLPDTLLFCLSLEKKRLQRDNH